MKPEEILHRQICRYLRNQYPNVIFTSEPSGLRLPIGQAKKLKELRSGNKLPDLWILEPKKNYSGLFMEIKIETPFKKDGTIKAGHFKEQEETLSKLRQKGYYSTFVWLFDHAVECIDWYMK